MSDKNRQTDKVAKTLAQRILDGTWPSGHKLPADTALCDEFNVSRTVIREALRLLGGKGLLRARPRLGTQVANKADWALWDRDILDWLAETQAAADYQGDARDMRLAIEPMLAALAAARADEQANQALQEALRRLQTDNDAAHETAFLAALYQAAGNQFAATALHLTLFDSRPAKRPPALAHYRELTAAIAQKDSAAARQAALNALLQL